MTISTRNIRNVLFVSALAVAASGCEKKTPAEKVGDKIEDMGDKVGGKTEDLGDKVQDKLDK